MGNGERNGRRIAEWLNRDVARLFSSSQYRRAIAICAISSLVGGACSNADNQLGGVSEPTVAGITTESTATSSTTAPTTSAPTTSVAPSTSERVITGEVELAQSAPTGLEVPLLIFSDSIRLIQPDGTNTLIERDDAIRVAGDTEGGVVFQRELTEGPQSSILWQPKGAAVPEAIFIPESDQRIELHGITTVTSSPEVVFSVTSPDSTNRSLNRISLQSGVITELAVVDELEFGSKSTQVDGLFIVTTWERSSSAGWTVYQSGTGREIGGSFPDIEASCANGIGRNCALLASLSLDINRVFRIVPHDSDSQPGSNDLLVTRSENGSAVTRVDLTSLEGEWYPEHLAELPDGKILLSRSVDAQKLRPTTGVVIDPASGSVESLSEVGFVRLP